MPKGFDSTWAEKLYEKRGRSKHFERPRFGTSAFLIHHFVDLVRYETTGFLKEKNRNIVSEEQIDVLRNGNNKLSKKLFSEAGGTVARENKGVRSEAGIEHTPSKTRKR